MTLANWLLAAAGIWGLALTWVGAFAATQQPTLDALDTNKPQMMREFGSWEMKEFRGPMFNIDSITTNLSDEDKASVESLLTELREWEKTFLEALDAATTDEEKDSIKETWEATKTSIKEKVTTITWESDNVENLFTRWWVKGPKGHFNGDGNRPERPNFENWERPELGTGELPEIPEINWERPELPNFEEGEIPELPEINGERPEMNWNNQFWPRGNMQGSFQGQQVIQEVR